MPNRKSHRRSRRTAGAHVRPAYSEGLDRLRAAYGVGKSIMWEAAIYSLLKKSPEEVRDALRWVGAIEAVGEAEEAVEAALEQHEHDDETEPEPAGR